MASSDTSDSSKRLVLLPVDSSVHAERAFTWYMDNLRKPGDKLGIVHIHENPVLPQTFAMVGPMVLSDTWRDEVKNSVEASQAVVKKFEERAKSMGIETETFLKTSYHGAGHGICELADDQKASAVVMGSRGLNGFRRTLLGSVSSYVVNHCRAAVTVTPPLEQLEGKPNPADAVPHHWSS